MIARVPTPLIPVLAGAALLAATPAPGQTVSALVAHAETSEPVAGALVRLLDDAGATVRRALTNERGLTLLTGVVPGRHRLRVEMIGMETTETGPFEIGEDQTVRREVRLPVRAIGLEGFRVEVEERCQVRPSEGDLAARLWDEARTALTMTTLTQRDDVYRYRTMLYERDLDRDGDVVRRETRSRREATLRTPFRSRPAEELMRDGFVDRSGETNVYFAPDAEVLLSDVFLDSHCFRPRAGAEGEETAGLMGLVFEPVELEGRRVDISGTLWVDAATSELRWLDYRYENLPPDIRSDELGGRVAFQRMPQGRWIVPRWSIRMPTIAMQRHPVTGESRRSLVGFREVGGVVLDAQGSGQTVGRTRTGSLEGVVRDSLGNAAEGVGVEIVGTERETSTDSAGRFEVSDLMEGTYQVRLVESGLRALGWTPVPPTRVVRESETSYLELHLPSRASVLAEACEAQPTSGSDLLPPEASGSGILLGWVRDAGTDEPLPGATVRVSGARWEVSIEQGRVREDPYHFETTADRTGFYLLCEMPEDEPLTIVGLHEGVESDATTLPVSDVGDVRTHTVRISRAPRPAG